MKIQRVLSENTVLPAHRGSVRGLKQWEDIKKSGNFIKVNGDVDFRFYDLKSLNGSPKEVHGDFDCSFNKLETLKGGPRIVNGTYHCNSNALYSLEGIPLIVHDVLHAQKNKLETLRNIHKLIKSASVINFNTNPIKSNILGLLLIKDLSRVVAEDGSFVILNKHLQGDKDVLECQEEMISAGFKEYARL